MSELKPAERVLRLIQSFTITWYNTVGIKTRREGIETPFWYNHFHSKGVGIKTRREGIETSLGEFCAYLYLSELKPAERVLRRTALQNSTL